MKKKEHLSSLEKFTLIGCILLSLQPACFAFTSMYNLYFVGFNIILFLFILYVVICSFRQKNYLKAIAFINMLLIICGVSYYEYYLIKL